VRSSTSGTYQYAFQSKYGKILTAVRRYIDWTITTPLLLLDLCLTAGLPTPTILWVILIDEIMIVCGLIGALVSSSYKFGYFVFGCVALFYIGYVLVWEGRKNAYVLGSDIGKTFFLCGTWTFFLWCLYPVAWGLCEGGNVISPDSEAVFYGVLDFLAKPCFGALLIWGHRNIEPERLGLVIHKYGARDTKYEKPQAEGPAGYREGGMRQTLRNGDSTVGTDAHV